MAPGQYRRGPTTPGGEPFDVSRGDHGIFRQYELAITNAERSIYIENQALEDAEIVGLLHAALDRGVEVVALVPAEAEGAVRLARRHPDHAAFFERLATLGEHKSFTMAGLASPTREGGRANVYVHGKIMLVDDAFATIGSCNIRGRSFFRHTEMNASVRDPLVVKALRRQLFAEHLGLDTGDLEDSAALRLFGDVARANAARRQAGDSAWQGIAFSFDPSAYAT